MIKLIQQKNHKTIINLSLEKLKMFSILFYTDKYLFIPIY